MKSGIKYWNWCKHVSFHFLLHLFQSENPILLPAAFWAFSGVSYWASLLSYQKGHCTSPVTPLINYCKIPPQNKQLIIPVANCFLNAVAYWMSSSISSCLSNCNTKQASLIVILFLLQYIDSLHHPKSHVEHFSWWIYVSFLLQNLDHYSLPL